MPSIKIYKIPLVSSSIERHNHIVKMASRVLISFISIVLLCISATQARKTLYTTNDFSAFSPVTGDGICKTLVEPQGYPCEEHKVNNITIASCIPLAILQPLFCQTINCNLFCQKNKKINCKL